MFILLHTLLLTAPLAPVEVQTLTGESIVGQLVELKQDRIAIAVGGERREISRTELSKVTFTKESDLASVPTVWVELVDGSVLPATRFSVQEGQAELVPAGAEAVKLAVKLVRSVRF